MVEKAIVILIPISNFKDHPVEAYFYCYFAVLIVPNNVRLFNLGFEDSRYKDSSGSAWQIADSWRRLLPLSYQLNFHLTPGNLEPLNPSNAILKSDIHTK